MEAQLVFSISISILPSIALKRCNLPDNLDFNGKIMAKFLIRSLISLNLKWYDNKITNWTQSYSKYVTCIMAFFTPFHFVTFGQFYPTLPLRYSLNFTMKLWNERKEDFLHICCLNVTRYIKQGRKWHLQIQLNF